MWYSSDTPSSWHHFVTMLDYLCTNTDTYTPHLPTPWDTNSWQSVWCWIWCFLCSWHLTNKHHCNRTRRSGRNGMWNQPTTCRRRAPNPSATLVILILDALRMLLTWLHLLQQLKIHLELMLTCGCCVVLFLSSIGVLRVLIPKSKSSCWMIFGYYFVFEQCFLLR